MALSLKIVNKNKIGLNRVPRRYRIFAMLGMVFITIFVLVLPTCLIYRREMSRNRRNMALLNIDRDDMDPNRGALVNRNQINVFLKVGKVDLKTLRMNVFVKFAPTGSFLMKGPNIHPGTLNIPGGVPMTLQIGESVNRTARTGDIIAPTELKLPLMNGDIEDYPFDSFNSNTFVSVKYTDFPTQLPPIGIVADGAIQNFNIFPEIKTETTGAGNQITSVKFSISRSSTTKGFAIFIIFLMWCLSLAALGVSIDIIMRKVPVPAPLLAMMTALIFALPALRNAIPGAPQIGAMMDILGFFWNMAFAGTSALLMISWYIVRQQDKTDGPQIVIEDDEDEDETKELELQGQEGKERDVERGLSMSPAERRQREMGEVSREFQDADEISQHIDELEKTLDNTFGDHASYNSSDSATLGSSGK